MVVCAEIEAAPSAPRRSRQPGPPVLLATSAPPKRIEGRTFEFSFPIPVLRHVKPPGTGKSAPKRHRIKKANPGDYEQQRRQDPERQQYHRNYQHKRRKQRITEGLCTRCPNTAIPGETYCETCLDLHRNKQVEYERARSQNPQRQESRRLSGQRRRQERKAAGLCSSCPNPAIPGQNKCEICRDKNKAKPQK